jgi:hypothetical protein
VEHCYEAAVRRTDLSSGSVHPLVSKTADRENTRSGRHERMPPGHATGRDNGGHGEQLARFGIGSGNMTIVKRTAAANQETAEIKAFAISHSTRSALAVVGIGSWLAGGAAAFLSNNGAGAAALVAAGTVCVVLALMGRWPSRVAMSGNELSWGDVKETVDSQIVHAEKSGEPDEVLEQLRSLRERLEVLERTGSVPEVPAATYDDAVEAALRRLLPSADILRQQMRSRAVPDFVVMDHGTQLFVETKWRQDVTKPFGGSTLPRLIEDLPAGARLLVVINTGRLQPSAAKPVEHALGAHGRIVTWRDARDDRALAEALTHVLAATETSLQS